MNKCKNNDESVIFLKINPGKLPDFRETSLHVSSSLGVLAHLPNSSRHGRVARQRVPATQSLSRRDDVHPVAKRISRALYDRHSGISGWPVRAAARHGHDELIW
jgi:hypothetical protein